jgi:peroxiredoxin
LNKQIHCHIIVSNYIFISFPDPGIHDTCTKQHIPNYLLHLVILYKKGVTIQYLIRAACGGQTIFCVAVALAGAPASATAAQKIIAKRQRR